MKKVILSFSKRWVIQCLFFLILIGCSGCTLPQVNAEERLFLPLTVDFVDEYILPTVDYEGTKVGGLSAIAYDSRRHQLYALSDDRGSVNPPRFYTLSMQLAHSSSNGNNDIHIEAINIDKVTFLTREDGTPYPSNTLDPEGISLSPKGTLFISSEGITQDSIAPAIDEFDRLSGRRLRRLPIPPAYIPRSDTPPNNEQFPLIIPKTTPSSISLPPQQQTPQQTIGVQNNRGFEALSLSAPGMGPGIENPFRIFAGIEAPLIQDSNQVNRDKPQPSRLLHYLVNPNEIFLLSEHVYPIDPLPFGAATTGLTEILSLDQGGHFLSLERSYGLGGIRAKLFQMVFSNATDISNRVALPVELRGLQTVRKRLVLDFYDLGIRLDNLEGMTLGPYLPDGSPSLLLISDNNFNTAEQKTQILLFRLHGLSK